MRKGLARFLSFLESAALLSSQCEQAGRQMIIILCTKESKTLSWKVGGRVNFALSYTVTYLFSLLPFRRASPPPLSHASPKKTQNALCGIRTDADQNVLIVLLQFVLTVMLFLPTESSLICFGEFYMFTFSHLNYLKSFLTILLPFHPPTSSDNIAQIF